MTATRTYKIVNEKRRTEKAILVDICGVNDIIDDLGRPDLWLPLSQITIDNNLVTIPEWFARKNGLNWS